LRSFISQSGETADTLAALRYAKSSVHTLSVVQCPDIDDRERKRDHAADAGGSGRSASLRTQSFPCQLMVLAALALAAGKARGELSDADEAKLAAWPRGNPAADGRSR